MVTTPGGFRSTYNPVKDWAIEHGLRASGRWEDPKPPPEIEDPYAEPLADGEPAPPRPAKPRSAEKRAILEEVLADVTGVAVDVPEFPELHRDRPEPAPVRHLFEEDDNPQIRAYNSEGVPVPYPENDTTASVDKALFDGKIDATDPEMAVSPDVSPNAEKAEKSPRKSVSDSVWRAARGIVKKRRHLAPSQTTAGRRNMYISKKARELGITFEEAEAMTPKRPNATRARRNKK